jgi:hypothetical protein
VKILGIRFDSVEDNRKFAEKYQFNFPLLCDIKVWPKASAAKHPGEVLAELV